MHTAIALLAGCLAVSYVLTALVLVLARRARLMDIPNERSSHAAPTPRGGGIAIVIAFTLGLAWLMLAVPNLDAPVRGLALAGLLVAGVGLIDDRWQLAPRWRMLAHLVAVAGLWWQMPVIPPLSVLGHSVDLGWAGPALLMLYMAWAINYFNFMDGIDGIAATETITVATAGALLNATVLGGHTWVLPALLAVSTLGFAVWNWSPARIFMGDAGSGFLGLCAGTFTIGFGLLDQRLLWCWLILQGCFMVDATVTLLRRAWRRQPVHQAHRSHAYQWASRRYRSHLRVTLAFGGITVLWLFPWALAVALAKVDGLVALLLSYVPLVALAYHFNAGASERQIE